MSSRLRQHYLELWQLAQALKEGWLEGSKTTEAEQLLKDAAANDPTLSSLNITSSKFLNDLISRLEPLILAQPEIPVGNLPAKNDLKEWEKQRQKYLEALYQTQKGMPVIFRDYRQRFANIPQGETYLILKKHGLVDSDGNYNFADPMLIESARQEIGRRLTYHRYYNTLRETITRQLEDQKLPLSLLYREFFGKEGVSGIIDKYTEEIAQANYETLFNRLEANLGGPINFLAPGFQAALDRAIKDTHNDSLTPRFQGWLSLRAQEITDRYLADSPKFRYLPPDKQNELKSRFLAGLTGSAQKTDVPTEIDQVEIEPADQEIILNHSTAFYGESRQSRASYHSYTYNSLAKKVQREFGLSETERSTYNISSFMKSFADDPLKASFDYPYYALIGLLPKPLKNLYWKNKKWQKNFNLWFGATTSPEGQRKALEKLGWTAIKAVGKQFGVVSQNGQWLHMSALGWLGDKAVTGVGEGLAWLPDRLGRPGKAIGKILHRRLGKKRKREDNLLTNLIGVVWDLAVTAITFLPKLAWWAINKIPGVRLIRTNIARGWSNLRYALETHYPFFKWLRIGKGIAGSIFKAASHGLVTGGLAYVVSGGSPGWAICLGGLDWFYHIFRNLNKIPEINIWARGAHGNIFSGIFGKIISSRWAYLPIKGPLIAWLITDDILPLLGIYLPLWAKILSVIGAAGIEYGSAVGWRWLTLTKFGKFFSGIPAKIFGIFGKIIGRIFFALPFLPLVWNLLTGVAAGPALAQWWAAGWGKWALFNVVVSGLIPFVANFLTGWITGMGFSAWLASIGGLSGLVGMITTAIGITTATLLTYFLIFIALVLGVFMIIGGAFIISRNIQYEYAPAASECFAPTTSILICEQIDPSTGSCVNPKDEADAGDQIIYTLSLNPLLNNIETVKVDSRFQSLAWPEPPGPDNNYTDETQDPNWTPDPIIDETCFSDRACFQDKTSVTSFGLTSFGPLNEGPARQWLNIFWESRISPLPPDAKISYVISLSQQYQGDSIMIDTHLQGMATITDQDGNTRDANCNTRALSFVNASGAMPYDWPISGRISQLPGGSFSHDKPGCIIECVDISNVRGIDIHATHDGNACGYNIGDLRQVHNPGHYGNYVVVTSFDGSFSTTYAHLDDGSISTSMANGSCQPVTAGAVIGKVDASGTTANHLHYQLAGDPGSGPNINNYLPSYRLNDQVDSIYD